MKRARWLGLPIGGLLGAVLLVRKPSPKEKLPREAWLNPRYQKLLVAVRWALTPFAAWVSGIPIMHYLAEPTPDSNLGIRFQALFFLYPIAAIGAAMLMCPAHRVLTGRVFLVIAGIYLFALQIAIRNMSPTPVPDAGRAVALGILSAWWITGVVAAAEHHRAKSTIINAI